MKTFRKLMLLAGLLTLVLAIPAVAQLTPGATFQAPGAFYAGNAKFPAGTYTIKPEGIDSGNLYEIRNNAGTHSAILETRPSSRKSSGTQPEVVFNRYGTTDYLQAILTNTGNSFDILPSPSAAEKLAAQKGTPQPHTVPAKPKSQ